MDVHVRGPCEIPVNASPEPDAIMAVSKDGPRAGSMPAREVECLPLFSTGS